MKLKIILIFAIAIVIGCSKSSPTDSNTPHANIPPGWTDSLDFGAYSVPQDFASFGSDLFLITNEQILHSADFGITVDERNAGIYFSTQSGGRLLTKDNYLFASVPGTGIMRSSDLGLTWTQVGKTIGASNPFIYNNTLYALGSGAFTAYSSTNNGDSWTGLSGGLPTTFQELFFEIGGKFYVYSHYTASCYSSSDQGVTWSLYTGPAISAIAYGSDYSTYACKAVTANGTTLVGRNTYYVPDTVAIWGAPSGSDNFTPRVTGLEHNIGGISSIVVSGNHVFAAGRGVYHSTDNGTTWADITPTNPVNLLYSTVGIAYGVLYAGGTGHYNNGELVRRPLSDF